MYGTRLTRVDPRRLPFTWLAVGIAVLTLPWVAGCTPSVEEWGEEVEGAEPPDLYPFTNTTAPTRVAMSPDAPGAEPTPTDASDELRELISEVREVRQRVDRLNRKVEELLQRNSQPSGPEPPSRPQATSPTGATAKNLIVIRVIRPKHGSREVTIPASGKIKLHLESQDIAISMGGTAVIRNVRSLQLESWNDSQVRFFAEGGDGRDTIVWRRGANIGIRSRGEPKLVKLDCDGTKIEFTPKPGHLIRIEQDSKLVATVSGSADTPKRVESITKPPRPAE